MGKFIEIISKMVVARGWWEEKGVRSYYLMGTEIQFCKMKEVLKMNGSDDCTTI